MNSLVNKKMIGFLFKDDNFAFTKIAQSCVGKIGTIIQDRRNYVVVKFQEDVVIYPKPKCVDYLVGDDYYDQVPNEEKDILDITKGIKCLVWDNEDPLSWEAYVYGKFHGKYLTYNSGDFKLWDNAIVL